MIPLDDKIHLTLCPMTHSDNEKETQRLIKLGFSNI